MSEGFLLRKSRCGCSCFLQLLVSFRFVPFRSISFRFVPFRSMLFRFSLLLFRCVVSQGRGFAHYPIVFFVGSMAGLWLPSDGVHFALKSQPKRWRPYIFEMSMALWCFCDSLFYCFFFPHRCLITHDAHALTRSHLCNTCARNSI